MADRDPLAFGTSLWDPEHVPVAGTMNQRATVEEVPMIQEFKKFAVRGSVVDMAVGIIIGGAFATIAKSLVNDILMPPIGLLLGGVDFSNLSIVLKAGEPAGPYETVAAADAAGAVTIDYGLFINNVVSFLVVAWAVFLLVKTIERLRREEATAPPLPSQKDCPACTMKIAEKATRCPHCTSELAVG